MAPELKPSGLSGRTVGRQLKTVAGLGPCPGAGHIFLLHGVEVIRKTGTRKDREVSYSFAFS